MMVQFDNLCHMMILEKFGEYKKIKRVFGSLFNITSKFYLIF